jgi:hypothetical protein
MRTIHRAFSSQDPESIDNALRERGKGNTDELSDMFSQSLGSAHIAAIDVRR